ncbi:hypothetical protein V8E54_007131 [Elaphomyces granulatus]
MADTSHRDNILSCVKALRDKFPSPFVLVGGAAALSMGSRRKTEGVDILVPRDINLEEIKSNFRTLEGFSLEGGKPFFRTGNAEVKVNVFTSVVEKAVFEDINEHTTILNGVKIMELDYALAIKVNCFYLRSDDDHGLKKRDSDARDIVFLSQKMIESGMEISEDCAHRFKVGFYHMLEIRMHLEDKFDDLITIGIRKLLLPWDLNTPEQREYYLCLAPEGTDPLTVSLDKILSE